MYQERFDRLSSAIQLADLDGLALNPGASLSYLTGLRFHLMERPTVLLVTPGKSPALVVPELEIAKVRSSPVSLQAFTYGDNPALWERAFHQAADFLGLAGKRVGVEPNQMRFLELQFLQNALPGAQFTSAAPVLDNLRMRKEAHEVAAMRQAVHIAQVALLETMPVIKPGTTEREIASELTIQLLRAGTDPELPFSPIVSGGPHSADPHAVPSDRPLQVGDLLVIDWGATYQGYISDLTRTFAIGEVETEFRHIADLVRLANEKGRGACRPGIFAGKVDMEARKVINEAGYGAFFFHRVGHGIGMEGHEPPYIFDENTLKLIPGMAFTVEPGIYLPGRGGVRIEDDVVITAESCETLSDLPRELIKI